MAHFMALSVTHPSVHALFEAEPRVAVIAVLAVEIVVYQIAVYLHNPCKEQAEHGCQPSNGALSVALSVLYGQGYGNHYRNCSSAQRLGACRQQPCLGRIGLDVLICIVVHSYQLKKFQLTPKRNTLPLVG